jgi:heptose I phosphotransferase
MIFFLSPQLAAALAPRRSFDEVMALEGPPIRAKEGRRTFRLELGGRGYFFKIHNGIGWREIAKELASLRKPTLSALAEKRAIEAVTRLGIPTMTVAGYGERGSNPATLQSFIATEEIADAPTLEELTAEWPRTPPSFRRKQQLLRIVADIARRLHEHGINHRDFYLNHFRLQGERLYLMDLHRAQLRASIPRRWRVKDIGALYFSAADIGLTRRDLLRFMRLYSAKPLRAILRDDGRFWRAVTRRAERFYRREWKRAMTSVSTRSTVTSSRHSL